MTLVGIGLWCAFLVVCGRWQINTWLPRRQQRGLRVERFFVGGMQFANAVFMLVWIVCFLIALLEIVGIIDQV